MTLLYYRVSYSPHIYIFCVSVAYILYGFKFISLPKRWLKTFTNASEWVTYVFNEVFSVGMMANHNLKFGDDLLLYELWKGLRGTHSHWNKGMMIVGITLEYRFESPPVGAALRESALETFTFFAFYCRELS